ncbi:RNase H-like protein 2 [Elsinoe australis]|uniref:ribonuclease H n=1 Tax=Elsinoe australis TaxID=40998 RepID=A0A4U7ATE4_9PEZI|nr:RNase H-like protein 2 [Elsinoe australis]
MSNQSRGTYHHYYNTNGQYTHVQIYPECQNCLECEDCGGCIDDNCGDCDCEGCDCDEPCEDCGDCDDCGECCCDDDCACYSSEDDDDEPGREFFPEEEEETEEVPYSRLVVYNREKQFFRLQIREDDWWQIHQDRGSMMVFIDGACRWNGQPHAMASYGVYFGPGSKYNQKGLFPRHIPQTGVRAEIEALAHALGRISDRVTYDRTIQLIIIACDCEFVVQAMCRLMDEWIEDGGVNSWGNPVADFDRLKELYQLMKDIEKNQSVNVRFWQIPREQNDGADQLANEALDEELDRWKPLLQPLIQI